MNEKHKNFMMGFTIMCLFFFIVELIILIIVYYLEILCGVVGITIIIYIIVKIIFEFYKLCIEIGKDVNKDIKKR